MDSPLSAADRPPSGDPLSPPLHKAADGVEDGGGDGSPTKTRDIRRYYCDYCGICRSKKALIKSHMLIHHKDKMPDAQDDKSNAEAETSELLSHTCQECGASFRKPAYLKQHMQSHSLERPFSCPLDDCHCSYRRKDHLTRHLLKHKGKLFTCPVDNCNGRFAFQGNMKRHVKEFHDPECPVDKKQYVCQEVGCGKKFKFAHKGKLFTCPVDNCNGRFTFQGYMKRHVKEHHDPECPVDKKEYVCQEVGCGKKFKYASQLRKHEETHAKLEYTEVFCGEPGCMKPFTNAECLRAHMHSCHRYVQCEICGTKQLKKNFKCHLHMHEASTVTKKIKCSFKGCLHTFSKRSNLNTHIKAVHQELRPFTCRFSGCGMKFPYRHVRDNHEKSGAHVYIQGDFVEADEHLHSRPRGGRKRKYFSVDDLMRKRIVSPSEASPLDDGTEYLRWLLSDD